MYLNTRKQYKWLSFSEDGPYLNVHAAVRARGDALRPLSIHVHLCAAGLSHSTATPPPPAQASAFHARVIVRFPGGACLVGSASICDASELAAREKVLLMLLQHRLGILGFLR
ncbi:LOW QUALITY PROTEIN: carboxylesterase 4A-like [Ursus americanus]|uniref:LOW QUALITY PROTEIN: carboxylesterase 4A-like n=1 Tax=Ursus americanus TaxID=9643 RepID=UPI001E67C19A|nr:LOW QUALITY PROTEIN: carboxylesterase 4A-like [Ursus americanus]